MKSDYLLKFDALSALEHCPERGLGVVIPEGVSNRVGPALWSGAFEGEFLCLGIIWLQLSYEVRMPCDEVQINSGGQEYPP